MGNQLRIPIQDYAALLQKPCPLNMVSSQSKTPVDGLRDGVPKTRRHDAVIQLQQGHHQNHHQNHLATLRNLDVNLFQDISLVLLARKGNRIQLHRKGWECRHLEFCVGQGTVLIQSIKFHMKAATYSQSKFYFALFSSRLKKFLGISEPFRIIYRSRKNQSHHYNSLTQQQEKQPQQQQQYQTTTVKSSSQFEHNFEIQQSDHKLQRKNQELHDNKNVKQHQKRESLAVEKEEAEEQRVAGKEEEEEEQRRENQDYSLPSQFRSPSSPTSNDTTPDNILGIKRSGPSSFMYADFLYSDGDGQSSPNNDHSQGKCGKHFTFPSSQFKNDAWEYGKFSSTNSLQVSEHNVCVHF